MMKSYEFDIAIIGGGCIGSSILYELCHRGFNSMVLIDQGRKTFSATANSGGMLRVFHESMEHISLSLHNLNCIATYRQLGVLTEKTAANGNLYFFNKNRYRHYAANLFKMDAAHYPFEVLTSLEGQKRFPHYHWDEDEWAIYEPMGCQLSPQKFTEDLFIASIKHGATLLDDCEVNRIGHDRDRFHISGQQIMVTAKTLVLSGGARLLPRLEDLGLHLPLEAKTLTTFMAEKTQNDFLLPNYFDREALNFGCFSQRRVVLSNPDSKRVIKKKWGEIIEQRTAQDCYALNRLGFLGPVPGHPGLMVATGWGGTAFKFALEVGRRVVNTIERGFSKKGRIYA
jgi:glycine/D-amino acid oxidase-like deaminating enzyme